jgi:antitoxin HicB
VEVAMKETHFSKAKMARRMHTSRATLKRRRDPDYDAVTLRSLRKAAHVAGRELRLERVWCRA